MCTTCGCGSSSISPGKSFHNGLRKTKGPIRYRPPSAARPAPDPSAAPRPDLIDFGAGIAGTHAPGISQSRMVRIERDILSRNNQYAEANRRYLAEHAILALNMVSSPGSGKTTLLIQTIRALQQTRPIFVIEGDQQTDQDAERIRATGVSALQINTGKGCHLDAQMIEQALHQLAPDEHSLLLIENVGNLVCPAAFDLGEAHKVVVLSVTEGEDKPLKYPDMFRAASLMLLNKCDLLPYLNFDPALAIQYARRVNPSLQIIQISATSGEGMPAWLDWISNSSPNNEHPIKPAPNPD
ncbi:MAG TPA: hydrogenase nickel incorporation protein HypB [Nitrosomonas halophila]|nr:hydrogenase nickel incorporation protein HypB [Nitrosomonas halophila]